LDWSAWVIFVFLIAAIGVGLYLVAYTRAGGFSNTHAPVFTTNVATESTPIQTITPTPEPVPTPTPTPVTTPPVQFYYLSGYVRDSSTNAPVSDARVYAVNTTNYLFVGGLAPSYAGLLAIGSTDSNGYYKTEPMAKSGPFFVSVIASGYEQKWTNNVTDKNEASQLTINAPDGIQKVDFTLKGIRSISGKVTDTNGNALYKVNILAFTYTNNQQIASAITNTDGTYKLSDLPPGTYCVKASPSSSKMPYADQYFNNVYDLNSAKAVAVNPGQDTPGINFTLPLK